MCHRPSACSKSAAETTYNEVHARLGEDVSGPMFGSWASQDTATFTTQRTYGRHEIIVGRTRGRSRVIDHRRFIAGLEPLGTKPLGAFPRARGP